MLNIGEIKKRYQAAADSMLPEFIMEFKEDDRAGVQKLVASAQKRLLQLEKERQRIDKLREYERLYADCPYICGIDEVGRGPLAGPVVAGAVILP